MFGLSKEQTRDRATYSCHQHFNEVVGKYFAKLQAGEDVVWVDFIEHMLAGSGFFSSRTCLCFNVAHASPHTSSHTTPILVRWTKRFVGSRGMRIIDKISKDASRITYNVILRVWLSVGQDKQKAERMM